MNKKYHSVNSMPGFIAKAPKKKQTLLQKLIPSWVSKKILVGLVILLGIPAAVVGVQYNTTNQGHASYQNYCVSRLHGVCLTQQQCKAYGIPCYSQAGCASGQLCTKPNIMITPIPTPMSLRYYSQCGQLYKYATHSCPAKPNSHRILVTYNPTSNQYACADMGEVGGKCNVARSFTLSPIKAVSCKNGVPTGSVSFRANYPEAPQMFDPLTKQSDLIGYIYISGKYSNFLTINSFHVTNVFTAFGHSTSFDGVINFQAKYPLQHNERYQVYFTQVIPATKGESVKINSISKILQISAHNYS